MNEASRELVGEWNGAERKINEIDLGSGMPLAESN